MEKIYKNEMAMVCHEDTNPANATYIERGTCESDRWDSDVRRPLLKAA
jgi:hypothetical protein